MQYEQLITTLEQLPTSLQQSIDQQFNMLFEKNKPLRLALVGSFSVGKSSLLNGMLNDVWLHAAQEEATALPTIIQYAPSTEVQLIYKDNSVQQIDRNQFITATRTAPEGVKCAVLGLNQEWLKDIQVVDLPGLGSICEKNQSFTVAQIQQADVVLYLLAPRGASVSDIDTIQLIQSYGKHLLILVNRWDEVEQAISSGERPPNLEQWQKTIQQATGYNHPLVVTHYQGLNHAKIFEFIAQAKENVQQIRLQRFIAEIRPQLENTLAHNLEQQKANNILNEEQIKALHLELLEKRNTLIELKRSLYTQQDHENVVLDQQMNEIIHQQKNSLLIELEKLSLSEEEWGSFIQQGLQQLRLAVSIYIQHIQTLMKKFGEIEIPEQAIKALNLRLPTVEPITSSDFLQIGQLNQLQEQLSVHQNEYQQKAQQQNSTENLDDSIQQLEQAIGEFAKERQLMTNMPIAMVESRVYDTRGSDIGRQVGEVVDNILFFLPNTAITKVGKALKLADKTIKKIQTAQQTVQDTKETVKEYTPLHLLNWLSVSTWTEKIGSLFDQPSEMAYVQDPVIKAQIFEQTQQLTLNIKHLRHELNLKQDMLSANKLLGFALEQKQKEIHQTQKYILELEEELKFQQVQAAQQQQKEQQELLERYRNRAIQQWMTQFDYQIQGIEQYLREHLKHYWTEVIDKQLENRMLEIEDIQQQMKVLPQQKASNLKILVQEEQQIRLVMASFA
ncbi:dynamin family protein [Acinetobacter lwoffii]|uniref:dynamin family protein n=1 Tax=Acinetobacter lwoffii TaxID=28090 RepID=UPI00209AD738|nr:dynamin family protein [Acinetobacter lwoffii]MCO8073047.1 dynamin family protein [Acinetobacter lwoffii]MCO8076139.1 dynamin family protein [Acinetobacter lwoffii]